MSEKRFHVPDGDPCTKCGGTAARHRVQHAPDGDPCEKCGAAAAIHRVRERSQTKKKRRSKTVSLRHMPDGDPCAKCGKAATRHRVGHVADGDPCLKCSLAASRHRPKPRQKTRAEGAPPKKRAKRFFMGVDGEGAGRDDHRYVFLGSANADKSRTKWVENKDGLTTEQCLEFLMDLPNSAKLFAYSFGYDLTMMLRDLPDRLLYLLFRPELRKRPEGVKGGLRAVLWKGWSLNLQGTKFTLKRGNKRRVVWDIFRFYQSKFVSALANWKAAPPEAIERMRKMKDERANFDKLYAEDPLSVWNYCLDECAYMAVLAEKLVDAHVAAGLVLKNFYGAGSSGGAMLDAMSIKEQIVPMPEEIREHVAAAFFGGRFENSAVGLEEGVIYNYDISSAYPYQLMFLPCLGCGTWKKTRDIDRARGARAALVHYQLDAPKRSPLTDTWAPLPFRELDGSICYPSSSPGGWAWGSEFFAGLQLFDNLKFREAWVYETTCSCQPFEQIAHYYRERVKLGKEGPGIVLKLGSNSCYGKLAQSVGSAPYNSWIWAGLITAGCRAQILEALGAHEDPRNLLMVATDGIFTREKLDLPAPRDTKTEGTKKPLGGWEEKVYERGIFVARPGVYFPLRPTEEEIKIVRGRGIGKGVVLACWKAIVEAFAKNGIEGSFEVTRVVRFCGAKSSISRYGPKPFYRYRRADGTKSSVRYGNWIERAVEMSFDPMPKRSGMKEGERGLALRAIDGHRESSPYDRAVLSEEAKALKEAFEEMMEQPDGDFTEYTEVD